jgi:hypothetical protein
MTTRRPPRPARCQSDENAAGVHLSRRNRSLPNPDEWAGPDVSLPPIPSKTKVSDAAERFSHSAAKNDAAPGSPRRSSANKARGNKLKDSGRFRHRELLVQRSSQESGLPRFENKFITFEMSNEMSCGDLTCASDVLALSPPQRAAAVSSDKIKAVAPAAARRKRPTNRTRTRSDSSHDHLGLGSLHEESENTGDHVSLSGICSLWKEHLSPDGNGAGRSPMTEESSRSDTRSWHSSDLELDLESEDLSDYDDSASVSKQIELQEEALLALALERSLADLGSQCDADSSHCSNSLDSHSSSAHSSINRANAQNLRKFRGSTRGSRQGARTTSSQLTGAGCHLSMIANNMKASRPPRRNKLSPMLGLKRADSSEEFDLLGPPSSSSAASSKAPPSKPGDDFVWERCVETKRWYKRPIKAQVDKSEDECMFEQVAELSMRDALKTSLGELQAVSKVRHTRHW